MYLPSSSVFDNDLAVARNADGPIPQPIDDRADVPPEDDPLGVVVAVDKAGFFTVALTVFSPRYNSFVSKRSNPGPFLGPEDVRDPRAKQSYGLNIFSVAIGFSVAPIFHDCNSNKRTVITCLGPAGEFHKNCPQANATKAAKLSAVLSLRIVIRLKL